MSLAAQLAAGVAELGVDAGPEAQNKLLAYLELMAKWNRVYNLTALRNPREWVTHHLLDSLSVLPHIRGPLVVDVGSGAGLPGLALAMARPDWQVVSVEAVDKKAAFQRQVAAELALTNVKIEGRRVEDAVLAGGADTVVSRAFSSLVDFVNLTRHLLKPDGQWAAMKGRLPQEEIAALPAEVRVREVIELKVPGLNAERCVVMMEWG
ncbi:16S rRNA (guanine(527)-N(7))-methyltransferase RsmG [Betaproteobacteria bacterium SCN2]|jgi:16S rRNA (guanine527-N7)-methyltransferase|nr:16S rRNA (guanine(527)-N(7))-methyltransferase RsmG [Betaproteobacteria bacterium SCN2]